MTILTFTFERSDEDALGSCTRDVASIISVVGHGHVTPVVSASEHSIVTTDCDLFLVQYRS